MTIILMSFWIAGSELSLPVLIRKLPPQVGPGYTVWISPLFLVKPGKKLH